MCNVLTFENGHYGCHTNAIVGAERGTLCAHPFAIHQHFNSLRAEGAFLISAKKENAVPTEVKVFSEQGGKLRIKLPFKTFISKNITYDKITVDEAGILTMQTNKGQTIVFENGYE